MYLKLCINFMYINFKDYMYVYINIHRHKYFIKHIFNYSKILIRRFTM